MSFLAIGTSKTETEQHPRLDERMLYFLSEDLHFPHEAVTAVVDYMAQHFEGVIFGPWHWKTFWGATPVTLPSIETLRKRVAEAGKEPPKPVEKMSAEECANFVGEQGTEDHPEVPQVLQQCLSVPARTPARSCRDPAGSTSAVTYIPQYVRKEGKVLAVTSRTLAYELGPKPVQGHAAHFHAADTHFSYTFSKDSADGTEAPFYYVMDLYVAPSTLGTSKRDYEDDVWRLKNVAWSAPEARNFIATVFSRLVWRGEVCYPNAYTHILETDLHGHYMAFGNFNPPRFGLCYNYIHPTHKRNDVGIAFARKFVPSVSKS